MNNRLYCTFTTNEGVEEITNKIQTSYVILFNKIFVLESLDGQKVMLTYNVDMNNSSTNGIIDNTILVHRKKQTNTLYTINALNECIKNNNNGMLDTKFQLNWESYRNCIMVTNEEGLRRIDTAVKEVIYIKVKK